MIGFLLGAGVGYVLGARAGRERYEKLVNSVQRVADHPAVQGAAGVARAKVEGVINSTLHRDQSFNGHAVVPSDASATDVSATGVNATDASATDR